MTNRSRLGLLAAAAIIAVVAFLALKPEEAENPTAPRDGSPAATAPSAPPSAPGEIVLRGGVPRGGVGRIEADKGDVVRLVVSSDQQDEIHLHGYDITRVAAPGRPARFRFRADVEGVFEIESHSAEDAGREPLVGRLVVGP